MEYIKKWDMHGEDVGIYVEQFGETWRYVIETLETKEEKMRSDPLESQEKAVEFAKILTESLVPLEEPER